MFLSGAICELVLSGAPTVGGVLPLDEVFDGALIDDGVVLVEEGVLDEDASGVAGVEDGALIDDVDEVVSVEGVAGGVDGVAAAGGGVGGVVSAGGVLLQATSVAHDAISNACDRFMVSLD